MPKINLPINIGVLLIFLGVIFMAIIEGGSISKALLGEGSAIVGGEIQQIAFVILTLVILGIATLHPKRLYLAAYSAMTLGLIVMITSFFGSSASASVRMIQIILSVVLIIGGFFVARSYVLTKKEKVLSEEGIQQYQK